MLLSHCERFRMGEVERHLRRCRYTDRVIAYYEDTGYNYGAGFIGLAELLNDKIKALRRGHQNVAQALADYEAFERELAADLQKQATHAFRWDNKPWHGFGRYE